MSETAALCPLLEAFTLGGAISSHHGAQCFPAIRENTDKKYIVKIISVPPTQAQLDALLITGAYRDPADAMEYFRQQAQSITDEAALLKKLSTLDGFLSYDSWQIVPITRHRLGYQVILIGSFKKSLEKYVRQNPVTHLEAVNLGLDLCAALAACRQAGSMYVDLKPSNIFLSEQKEYRIGDLGFISLDAMHYSVIPDQYRSVYTPPELHDPMASLNMTVDTYAVGMILYQIYNDGQLPFHDKAPQEPLPSPINADYELAEILMKAIHPDPFQRWNDPAELGQALRDYMQRNSINDDPITLHTPLEVEQSQEDPASHEASASDASTVFQKPEEPVDETQPGEEDVILPHEMSDELSKIVAKADDLISHETPGGVVLPEIPEPADPFAFAKSDELDEADIPVETERDEAEQPAQEPEKKQKKENLFISPDVVRRRKKLRSTIAGAAILAVVGTGSFLYYRNIYLQNVRGITLAAGMDQVAVTIDSDISDSLLTISCTDSGGKVLSQEVVDGKALFTDLKPDSTYTLELSVNGFHALTGTTTQVFNTDATTKVLNLSTTAGAEDGSVILSFDVEGEEPQEWSVIVSTDGEESRVYSFSNHSVTIPELTVGKLYTLQLTASDTSANTNISISGETSLEYLASRLVLAKNLTLSSADGTDLTVRWDAPGDVIVSGWTVRCFNDSDYDQQTYVTGTQATFTGVSLDSEYTIQVIADGMSQPSVLDVSANPAQVSGFTVDVVDDTALHVAWEYTGSTPKGGWLLTCAVDGSVIPTAIACEEASAVIDPHIPGASYRFTLQAADGTTICNSVFEYDSPEAAPFSANKLSADNLEGWLLKSPGSAWHYESLGSDPFTDSFVSGDLISVVLHSASDFYLPGSETKVLYVIRDSLGNVLPELVSEETLPWNQIWDSGDVHYGELDVPNTPSAPGSYTLDIYMDGNALISLPFSIA